MLEKIQKRIDILIPICSILTIIGTILPVIIIDTTNITLISDNIGKIIILCSVVAITLFIIRKPLYTLLPSAVTLILIVTFYFKQNNELTKINSLIENSSSFGIGFYLILITSIINIIIALLCKSKKNKTNKDKKTLDKNSKYKTCPNCGATLLKTANKCFLCNKKVK